MKKEEIKEELLETFKNHKGNTLHGFFLNLGFIKGLHRANAISSIEMTEFIAFIQEKEGK